MVIRIKSRKRKSYKRIVGVTRRKTKTINSRLKKGVGRMTVAIQVKDSRIELEENVKLNCMSNIRNRAQRAMKEKGYTEEDVKRILEMVRNEK